MPLSNIQVFFTSAAHDTAVTKIVLILAFVTALAGGLAQSHPEPPLLIDSAPAAPATSLDANS